MIITVNLNQSELAVCRIIGNMRSISARAGSVTDVQMGKNNPLDIDEDGVIGEYAFCKHWNIFFDPSVSPRSGSYDCLLHHRRFDIKTTRHKEGKLIATMKHNPDVDIYALAVLIGNTVLFPGYALQNDLCQESNITDLGYGSGYAMTQSQLTQWK